MSKKVVNTTNAPAPIGPYNQAIAQGPFLFLSGQVALIPGSDTLDNATITDEANRVMQNLKAVLNANNNDFADIVKTTIFLTDMSLFAQVNEVYASYMQEPFPARETVAVVGLPKGVNVEISMIAYKEK